MARRRRNPFGLISVRNPDGSLSLVDRNGRTIQAGGHPYSFTGANPTAALVNGLNDLPAGSFDPAIEYSAGAANRGLGYQQQDYGTQWAGLQTDAQGNIVRPGDLNARNPGGSPKYGRGLQDYFQQRDRLTQQHDTTVADLLRNYQRLGSQQTQAAAQAGVAEGGALAQALQKRTANEAHDQAPIDTAYSQGLSDLLTQTTRGATDAYTGLQRAVGENAPYQATLFTQAAQQAAPSLADNPNYEIHGNTIYQRLPSGGVRVRRRRRH